MFSRFKKGIKKHRVSIAFATPFLLIFFVFTIIPVFLGLLLSFTDYNILQPPQFVGFRNYLSLFFKDPIFLVAIKNTLLYALVLGPVSFVFSLLIAWMINDFSEKMRVIITFIFYLPTLAGGMTAFWILILSGDSYGYANAFFQNLGIIQKPIQW